MRDGAKQKRVKCERDAEIEFEHEFLFNAILQERMRDGAPNIERL